MAMGIVRIEDLKWIGDHYSELQRKYPDMYIAVKDCKVIAMGKRFGEVYDKAKKLAGEENFVIDYMLTGGVLGQAYIQILRSAVQG
jgi:hypothetical protein